MSNTTNLSLFKHDNPTTNTNAFDIERALNENWDKVDNYAGEVNSDLETISSDIAGIKVEQVTQNTNIQSNTTDITSLETRTSTNETDISNIKTEQTTQNNRLSSLETDNTTNKANIQTNTSNITALTGRVSTNETNIATLQTDAGNKLELVLNNTTYVLTATLKNKAGTVLSTSNVDFPVEELIVNMTYDSATKELVITLKNGQTRRISIEDVIDGLVNETDFNALEDRVETNETDIETLQAKNEALEQECEALRNDLNNSTLTISGNGENVTLENTAEARFKKLEVGGNSKQETTEGRNLLNYRDLTNNAIYAGLHVDEEDYVYSTNPSSDTRSWSFSNSNWKETLEPGTYVLSFIFKKQITSNSSGLSIFDSNGNSISFSGTPLRNTDFSSNVFTITEEKEIGFEFKSLDGVYRVQLEKNSSYTDWEKYTGGQASPNTAYPSEVQTITGNANVVVDNGLESTDINYKSQSYLLPLGNMELCKIRNYKDYIYKKSGKWYKHKSINKVFFDGSADENWTQETTSSAGYRYFIAPTQTQMALSVSGNINAICNKLIATTGDLSWGGAEGISAFYNINIYLKEYSQNKTLAEFKNWLTENPLTVYYILNKASEEEITDTALISVLNQIEKTAHSYSDITHIYSTDELSPIFDAQAVGDLNAILANQNQENS